MRPHNELRLQQLIWRFDEKPTRKTISKIFLAIEAMNWPTDSVSKFADFDYRQTVLNHLDEIISEYNKRKPLQARVQYYMNGKVYKLIRTGNLPLDLRLRLDMESPEVLDKLATAIILKNRGNDYDRKKVTTFHDFISIILRRSYSPDCMARMSPDKAIEYAAYYGDLFVVKSCMDILGADSVAYIHALMKAFDGGQLDVVLLLGEPHPGARSYISSRIATDFLGLVSRHENIPLMDLALKLVKFARTRVKFEDVYIQAFITLNKTTIGWLNGVITTEQYRTDPNYVASCLARKGYLFFLRKLANMWDNLHWGTRVAYPAIEVTKNIVKAKVFELLDFIDEKWGHNGYQALIEGGRDLSYHQSINNVAALEWLFVRGKFASYDELCLALLKKNNLSVRALFWLIPRISFHPDISQVVHFFNFAKMSTERTRFLMDYTDITKVNFTELLNNIADDATVENFILLYIYASQTQGRPDSGKVLQSICGCERFDIFTRLLELDPQIDAISIVKAIGENISYDYVMYYNRTFAYLNDRRENFPFQEAMEAVVSAHHEGCGDDFIECRNHMLDALEWLNTRARRSRVRINFLEVKRSFRNLIDSWTGWLPRDEDLEAVAEVMLWLDSRIGE